MKTIEILLDTEQDYTIYMLYDQVTPKQKRLLGINFNCGAGNVYTEYMEVDEELTNIYTTRFKGNLNAEKIDILRESIDEFNMNRLKREFQVGFEAFLEGAKTILRYDDKNDLAMISDVVNTTLNMHDMI